MASHSDKLSKVDQLLQVAAAGNLRRMKKLAKELDDGRGIAETLANSKDSHGRTVIHVAAQKGRTEICKYLIEELKLHIDEKDHEADCTPLLCATCEGHVRTVAYLIDHGANPAAFNRHNKTALHIAVDNGFDEMIKLLLSKDVDVNAPCDEGTPLQLAARNCKQNILNILLDHGANPNPVGTLNPSPLMWAIAGNSLTCIRLLIQRGADPKAVAHRHTPLTLACSEENYDIIKCLLEVGADPNIVNDSGLKPIEIAARNANLTEVGILFPVTSPIPTFSDWSIKGIMKYMNPEEARQRLEVGIYYDIRMLEHRENGGKCEEKPERCTTIYDKLVKENMRKRCKFLIGVIAKEADLRLSHYNCYLAELKDVIKGTKPIRYNSIYVTKNYLCI